MHAMLLLCSDTVGRSTARSVQLDSLISPA